MSLALLFALMVAACHQREEAPCGLQVCDIRDPECQRIAAEGAACLRGVSPTMVPVKVITSADYVSQQMTAPLTPVQLEAFTQWHSGLALWGLAAVGQSPADTAASRAARTGAYYSQDEKAITVILGDWSVDSREAVALLVHEFTHALQDSAFGLTDFDTRFAIDLDRGLAIHSLIEGEATTAHDRADVGLFGRAESSVSWDTVFSNWRRAAQADAVKSTMPVDLAWSHFNYAFGTPFARQAYLNGGAAAVDALHDMPPSGTREVAAGYGAAEPAGGPWAEELGGDAVAVLPDPFVYFDSDRLGAWIFNLYLARTRPGPRFWISNLRGDRLSIYKNMAAGTVVAVWRLRFATSDDAAAVSARLTAPASPFFAATTPPVATGALRIQQVDRDLVLTAAATPAELATLPQDLTFQSTPAPGAGPTGIAAAGAPAPGVFRCGTRRP